MNQVVEITLNDSGYIDNNTVPVKLPILVDKKGVLVVKARPLTDLIDITSSEREKRVLELLARSTKLV